MPAKASDAIRSHAIKLYLGGLSVEQLAPLAGVSTAPVYRWLREAGVTRRLSEARRMHFARGGKPSRQRADIPMDEIVARYATGESANSIAHGLKASHCAISQRLRKAGVAYRSVAEAAPLRPYDQMQARGAESRSRKVGFGEDIVFQWLVERGEAPERQFPVGKCNVDMAIGAVAVEIETGGFNPFAWPRTRKRIKYLGNRGWSVVSVLVSLKTAILLPDVADKIVAIVKRSRENPTAPREHWVIRGCGEVAATAGNDFADVALIPASVSCPHHGATYKRPPH